MRKVSRKHGPVDESLDKYLGVCQGKQGTYSFLDHRHSQDAECKDR